MALTKITTNIIEDDAITADKIAAGAIDSTHVTGLTTTDIGEGTNLYFTDARVGSYLTTNSYATESYVTTAVSNLVDAAPATLDTLNELAAALGDDANFSTTVTNSIATKVSKSGDTMTGNLGVSGNVGVGTTSPSNTFHVYNTASADAGLIESTQTFSTFAFKSSTNSSTVTIGIDGAGNGAFENKLADGNLTFVTKNSLGTSAEAIRIKGDGKVGVGTTSPSTGLHSALGLRVSGASNQTELNNPTSPSANIGVFESGGTSYGFIDLASDAGSYGGWIDFSKSNGTDYGGRIRYDNSVDELDFYTNGSLTPSVKINSLGQLELNNPNAGQELIISTTSTSAGADPGIQILEPNSATVGAYIFLDTSAGTLLDLESPNGIAFNGSGGAEFGRFTSGGNFGVGTTNPLRRLEVTGTLAITNSSGIQYLLMGNQDSSGVNNPRIIVSANGELNFGKGNNWSDTYGGTFSSQMLLTNDGNLGIGSSSFSRKFNTFITRSDAYNPATFETGSLSNYFRNTDTTIGSYVGIQLAVGNNSDTGIAAVRTSDGNAALTFGTRGTGSSYIIERARIQSNGSIGIGTASPSTNCKLHITDADVQMELQGTQGASSGFINFDGTNLQFSTTRDMKTGAFRNTGKTHAGITLSGPSTGSIIRFYTTASVNTSASTRGLVLPYGEWVIGATETHSISTDFIHSIGTINRQNLPSSAYARLVMQERTGDWISFVNGTPVHFGTISVSGSGVNYGSNSDYRLKENIIELPNAIERVKLLNPKRFNFISAPEETRDGFLAHEVQEVVPEAVVGEKDGYLASGNVIDSEGNILKENVSYPETLEEGTTWVETKREPKYQNLDNSHLVPLLTKALQDAIQRIENLEAEVASLKGE